MVLFILTRDGYEDVWPLITTNAVWANHDVLSQAEISDLRASGVNLSTFSSRIDPDDDDAIQSAIVTIAEHHPGERIWIETQSIPPHG
jgi:hypothetical protein